MQRVLLTYFVFCINDAPAFCFFKLRVLKKEKEKINTHKVNLTSIYTFKKYQEGMGEYQRLVSKHQIMHSGQF
jgi:hypothetical protein